jgi:TRAP-type C4-dicarboxylate transport system substrate-binding protein
MKKPTFRTAVILLLTTLPLALLFSTYISGQETGAEVIKLGTLAVKGSSWGNVFEKMDEELQAESKGTLKFKFYFGRDESDLLEILQNQHIDDA